MGKMTLSRGGMTGGADRCLGTNGCAGGGLMGGCCLSGIARWAGRGRLVAPRLMVAVPLASDLPLAAACFLLPDGFGCAAPSMRVTVTPPPLLLFAAGAGLPMATSVSLTYSKTAAWWAAAALGSVYDCANGGWVKDWARVLGGGVPLGVCGGERRGERGGVGVVGTGRNQVGDGLLVPMGLPGGVYPL